MNENNVKFFFNPDYARSHGCAWFIWDNNDVHNPEKTGGWASIGGEPAFKFNRYSDLPKDITWWTNLTKSEAWSLGRLSHIKHANFLGPNWFTLMSEWGSPKELEELKIACSSWSEVISRIGQWLEQWCADIYKDKNKDENNNKDTRINKSNAVHPFWKWGDGTLPDAISNKLNCFVPKNTLHPAFEEAFYDIINENVTTKNLKYKRKLTLCLPRLNHAQKILNSRYPEQSFNEVLPSDLPNDIEKKWDWIIKQEDPLIIRFDEMIASSGNEDILNLWLGLRGKRFYGASMEPIWLTAEEALYIRTWIISEPSVILKSNKWLNFNKIDYWPTDKKGILYNNSIVTGLLSESLWRALSTPSRTPSKRIKSAVTPQMIWWRSVDRKLCFEVAKIFYENHFQVLSYGEGTVTILFDEKTLLTDWVNAIVKSGVCVPKSLAKYMPLSMLFSNKNVDKWLKQSCSMDKWLYLDRLLWPWLGSEPKALKEIMAIALKGLGNISPPVFENSVNHQEDGKTDITENNINFLSSKEWEKEWKKELLEHSRSSLKKIIEFNK